MARFVRYAANLCRVDLVISMVVSCIVGIIVDIYLAPNIRPYLSLNSALLLAHVLPTFFLAFRDFDDDEERMERFVYSKAGPLGFGFFTGGVLRSIYLEIARANVAEATTPSSLFMTAIAAAVAIAYWHSTTMSHDSLWKTFTAKRFPEGIYNFLVALRTISAHYLWAEGAKLLMTGNISFALKEWFPKAIRRALEKGINPTLVIQAHADLIVMTQELETNREEALVKARELAML